VLASIGSPIVLEVFSVLIRTGIDAHQDAAFIDALLIFFGTILRNAGADERTD